MMRRRDFLGAGGAATLLANTSGAVVTDHNFDRYDFGPGPPVTDRAPIRTIAIGRHGLVAEQGHRRGLLLPQVATEWQWTAEQFLRQTCLKAGLSADAWKHGARISRFDAEVFGD